MVRLVKLDEDGCEEVVPPPHISTFEKIDINAGDGVERANLNFGTGFARAMGCYP